MKHKKLLCVLTIFLLYIPYVVYGQHEANEQPQLFNLCKQSVDRTITRLKATRAYEPYTWVNQKVEPYTRYRNHTQEYTSYPQGKVYTVSFGISGPGVENIANSPTLMKALSAEIVKNCEEIGVVEFVTYMSSITFGLVNNKISEFTYYEPKIIPSSETIRLPWGTYYGP